MKGSEEFETPSVEEVSVDVIRQKLIYLLSEKGDIPLEKTNEILVRFASLRETLGRSTDTTLVEEWAKLKRAMDSYAYKIIPNTEREKFLNILGNLKIPKITPFLRLKRQ